MRNNYLSIPATAAAIAVFTLASTPAKANSTTTYLGLDDGNFGLINTETREFTSIGYTEIFYDIAIFESHKGYGITSQGFLYEIDLLDASTSLIGDTGTRINSLGFDDSGNLLGFGGSQWSNFYRISTVSAGLELLSTIQGFRSSGDVVFDGNKFYMTSTSVYGDKLFSINSDGTDAIEVGLLKIGSDKAYGLSYEDGRLLGFTSGNEIIEINKLTGEATSVGEISGLTDTTLGAATLVTTTASEEGAQLIPEPGMLLGLGMIAGLKLYRGRYRS
jgi:hypothetical protein